VRKKFGKGYFSVGIYSFIESKKAFKGGSKGSMAVKLFEDPPLVVLNII
jgi:hypothetical protein